MNKKRFEILALAQFTISMIFLSAFLGAQVALPTPTQNPNSGGQRVAPSPQGQTPGSYSGPQGTGRTGGFAPSGGGELGGNPGSTGPGGTGRPNGQTVPGGNGSTGGSGGGPQPTDPPGNAPGSGVNTPGSNPTGSGGTVTPGNRRRSRSSGSLGQGVEEVSWQNWWALNQGYILDLERRYQARSRNAERNPDLFTGDDATDREVLIESRDEIVIKRTLPMLRSFLEHETFQVRAQAALAVGRVGSKEQVAWLAPMTKDKNRQVRKAAILGLGLLKTERALTMLKYLERDRRTPLIERAYAAVAMGLVGKAETATHLIESLSKGRRVREIDAARLYALGMLPSIRARRYLDYFVAHPLRDTVLRAVALNALALHRDVSTVDTMMRALKDQDVRVRRSAASALGQIDFTSRYRGEWEELEAALGGDDTVNLSDRVIGEFESYRARLRVKLEADESRLQNKRKDVVELIARHGLNDGDVMVRNFCAISLGEIGGKRAVEILIGQIYDAALNSTRAFAALGLALTNDASAGTELHNRLIRRRLNQETKSAFHLAIGLTGHADAKDRIRKHFKSGGDTAVARYSAIALALLGDDKIRKPLRQKLLQKSRPELKAAYGQALSILGDYDVVDQIGKTLARGSSVGHQVALISAVAAIQDARSLELLLKTAEKKRRKDLVLAQTLRSIGVVAERGDRPLLAEWFRHLNYPLRIVSLNEIALL